MNTGEALRYLGAANPSEELRRQAEEIAGGIREKPRYTYRVFALTRTPEGIVLDGSGVVLAGRMAETMLSECGQAALLACTLGAEFDRRLRGMQVRDMASAVILDACGSALVEEGCDAAETELAGRFPERFLTDRFSPGYGDLPLDVQPEICAALDTPRRLGLYVTGSLLMNPMKSVTAVIGLSDRLQAARIRGCGHCRLREDCPYRKGGKHCGEGV